MSLAESPATTKLRTCLSCGKEFLPTGRNHRFCCIACRPSQPRPPRHRGPRGPRGHRHLTYVAKKAKCANKRARLLGLAGRLKRGEVAAQYNAQDGTCAYCGCGVGDCYHVDHIVPMSRGGANSPENIAIACGTCNTAKRDRLVRDWVVNVDTFTITWK